jgi:hypothetical protein
LQLEPLETRILLDGAASQYIAELYHDLLRRNADSAGLSYWSGLLNQGVNRSDVVLGIESSVEYRTQLVEGLYNSYLRRGPDSAGLGDFVSFLSTAGTADAARAQILGSTEYFRFQSGNTRAGFVTALYRDVLDRPVDPQGASTWNAIPSSPHAAARIAQGVLASPEAHQRRVESFYERFLRRPADADGLAGLASYLQEGGCEATAIAVILSSDEYWNRIAQATPPSDGIALATTGARGSTVAAHFTLLTASTASTNEVGLFAVDDASGRVGALHPGDPGYASTALARTLGTLPFTRGDAAGETATVNLPGGGFAGFYMIQNSTLADWKARNPENLPGNGPLAFFSLTGANPDWFGHVRATGSNGYDFEDSFGGGDRDFNDLAVTIQQGAPDRAPVITSSPPVTYQLSSGGGVASGNVSPTALNLSLVAGATTTQRVSLTLPPTGLLNKVDVFLLFDDTGSFESTTPTLTSAFPNIMHTLQMALPQVSFGFGVGRIEDYGGGFLTESPQGRPYILNQPIVTTNTPGFEAAIEAALRRTTPGFGGMDSAEADIEALYQTATGAGFDGNGNGNTTDSGPAGPASTQLAPGPSGDVPAFSTFAADATNHILPPAGTRGGAGFRPGALPVILLATDSGTVYEPDSNLIIHGTSGATVPLSELIDGSRASTPGDRGATIQGAINALNRLGALVIGLGTGILPDQAPRSTLQALATLTGAVNHSSANIDSGIAGEPIRPGDPLYFLISDSSGSTVAAGIRQAITSALTRTSFDLDLALSDPAVHFVNQTGIIPGVSSGQTAAFNVQFTGDGQPHNFDLQFVRSGTEVLFGSIPVNINHAAGYSYAVQASDPDGDPLNYSLPIKPAGATINSHSGRIKWLPTATGSFAFEVRVADGRGGVAIQDFTVVVS